MSTIFNDEQREVLSDLVSSVVMTTPPEEQAALKELTRQLINYLFGDDPGFNVAEFKQACGLPLDGSEPVPVTEFKTPETWRGSAYYSGDGDPVVRLDDGTEVYLVRVGAGRYATLMSRTYAEGRPRNYSVLDFCPREGVIRRRNLPRYISRTTYNRQVRVK